MSIIIGRRCNDSTYPYEISVGSSSQSLTENGLIGIRNQLDRTLNGETRADWQQRHYEERNKAEAFLRRRIAALKGALTKAKRRGRQ